ncbi:universal stress protein [Skermania sp. ID1734]|uniref:universal stress protein n=1 Tax=Skermania sp. ID1734 TaxID=2597516 RepID=UPI00117FD60A|nr:universal stress protein [Skermania sp. ID1734]TSD96583.1 universal stress protein [Skermania sp. ID1734]
MHVEYSHVIIGTDGAAPARHATTVGGAVAARLALPVVLVTAWKSGLEIPGAREQSWASMTTKAAEVDLSQFALARIHRIEAKGDPADVLIDITDQSPRSLLLVGGRGLGTATGRLTSSTSNQLSHRSPSDVLFVHNRLHWLESVALATDGSATSITAARQGLGLAKAFGAQVILVTANSNAVEGKQVLANVAEALEPDLADTSLTHEVVTGDPATAIPDAAAGTDLLVIGNRGMSGFARMLGSTANSITHRATSNLLLVNTARISR